jgi:hypothetical protein
MFLDFLKEIFLKRKLKNSFPNVKDDASGDRIRTVGLLLDETHFTRRAELVSALERHGIAGPDISVLAFRGKTRKNEPSDHSVFTMKDVSWAGDIESEAVSRFTAQRFDLLVSYYDVERPALMLVTARSEARFKAGFSAVDRRLSQLTIATVSENDAVFVDEMFRYLKILNKI